MTLRAHLTVRAPVRHRLGCVYIEGGKYIYVKGHVRHYNDNDDVAMGAACSTRRGARSQVV